MARCAVVMLCEFGVSPAMKAQNGLGWKGAGSGAAPAPCRAAPTALAAPSHSGQPCPLGRGNPSACRWESWGVAAVYLGETDANIYSCVNGVVPEKGKQEKPKAGLRLGALRCSIRGWAALSWRGSKGFPKYKCKAKAFYLRALPTRSVLLP